MMNFLNNLITLFYVLFKYKIDWKYIASKSSNSTININTNIISPSSVVDSSVGFGTYIAERSRISKTRIGKFCSIGPNFLCGFGIHPINGVSTSPIFYSTKNQAGFSFCRVDKLDERKIISIGNDVFIGANVTVLDGVTIGDGAVIGAGSVISKDIPAYAVAVGAPIKVIKYRFDDIIIKKMLEIRWWDQGQDTFTKLESNFWDVESFIDNVENDI